MFKHSHKVFFHSNSMLSVNVLWWRLSGNYHRVLQAWCHFLCCWHSISVSLFECYLGARGEMGKAEMMELLFSSPVTHFHFLCGCAVIKLNELWGGNVNQCLQKCTGCGEVPSWVMESQIWITQQTSVFGLITVCAESFFFTSRFTALQEGVWL